MEEAAKPEMDLNQILAALPALAVEQLKFLMVRVMDGIVDPRYTE